MNIVRISLLAFLCFSAVGLSFAKIFLKNRHSEKTEFSPKSLAWKERFMLFMASKMSPKSFQGVPAKFMSEISPSDYEIIPYIDNFFVDARQLFAQVSKLSEDANLPEFNWGYRYDFCIWVICIDMEVRYTTKDSKFIGAENVKSSTEITPTTITNTFDIPFFNWTSSGFLVNLTDYGGERHYYNKNSYYSFENLTIAFRADYEMVPEVGLQLGNLSIYFNAGKVRGGLMEFETWDFYGNLLESYVNDPEEFPIDEYMMENWDYSKRQYTSGLEYSLNCFFSNGRSDPDNCMTERDEIESDYVRLLNMQLVQTLLLGGLMK